MPKSTITVAHTLGEQEAVARLQQFLEKVRDKFQGQVSDLEESWQGAVLNFAFKTFGFKIKGNMEVKEGEVTLQQDLPIAAMMFKGKIEEQIRHELTKLLG